MINSFILITTQQLPCFVLLGEDVDKPGSAKGLTSVLMKLFFSHKHPVFKWAQYILHTCTVFISYLQLL